MIQTHQHNIGTLYDNAWLNLTDQDILKAKTHQPLSHLSKDVREHMDHYLVQLFSNPDYFYGTCKYLLNVELLPVQCAALEILWNHSFPMMICARGFGKTFLLGVYALLRMLLIPNTKVIMVGAAFRQSRLIMEVVQHIWDNAPILRNIGGQKSGFRHAIDRITFRLNDSVAHAIPVGNGDKIRGLRANVILADEFGSISEEVYETVIAGFTAVSQTPIDNVKASARRAAMKQDGIWKPEHERQFLSSILGNQAILSGTADFDFTNFAEYWRRYKKIIYSRGDNKALSSLFDSNNVPDNFNWKDYAIVRIPIELVPEGFMDENHIARSKATLHSGVYSGEYGATFAKDSLGFFKMSLVVSCVTHEDRPINVLSGPVWFDAMVVGNPTKSYVIAVDPASENDNFSVVVLELHNDHRRVVYCWTITRARFQEIKKAGLSKGEDDFYRFCSNKIRDLMKLFPCQAIAMDSQGGGVAIAEILASAKSLASGNKPILPIIDADKPKDTDDLYGLHILHLINFADSTWTSTANHGLRADMESKILLFPRFDPVVLAMSLEDDKMAKKAGQEHRLYDSLEDCVMEIEELKNELATIVMTRTGTGIKGRDHWDTPEIKLSNQRKGRLRKDRYSSLLMANMVARSMDVVQVQRQYQMTGGFSHTMPKPDGGALYVGPDWLVKGLGNIGVAVNRTR